LTDSVDNFKTILVNILYSLMKYLQKDANGYKNHHRKGAIQARNATEAQRPVALFPLLEEIAKTRAQAKDI
jgi:cell fate (sporulation/competence/biofilm development) regulator YmcA (YheA/YmcA/DUF963 family)